MMRFLFDTDLDALNAQYNSPGDVQGENALLERLKAGIRIIKITEAADSGTDTLHAQIEAMNQSIASTQTMIDQFKDAEDEIGSINYLIDNIRSRVREVVEDGDCDPLVAQEDQADIRIALRAIDQIAQGLQSHRKVWWTGSPAAQSEENANDTATAACVENSVSLSLPDLNTHTLGLTALPGHTLANIDVTSASNASRALCILNAASATVDSCWEQLRAFRRIVLQPACDAMSIQVGNVTASSTALRDADEAQEEVETTPGITSEHTGGTGIYSANKLPAPFAQLL